MEKEILERLIEEYSDLSIKIGKLREFIGDTNKFESLDDLNKDLLVAQLNAMSSYIAILLIRINLNSNQEEANEADSSN